MNDELRTLRLEQLARHIELGGGEGRHGFDMTTYAWRHECGTTCCIAGHTLLLFNPAMTFDRLIEMAKDGRQHAAIATEAALYLGLNHFEATELFYRWGTAVDAETDVKAAAQRLRTLKKDEEVR